MVDYSALENMSHAEALDWIMATYLHSWVDDKIADGCRDIPVFMICHGCKECYRARRAYRWWRDCGPERDPLRNKAMDNWIKSRTVADYDLIVGGLL